MAINKNALQAKLQSDRENRAHIPEQNTESKMKQVLSATSTVPQPKQKKKPKKETHKTFTTWVEKQKLAEWKAYIATKNIKSEDLALYAIQHWIDQVAPITPEEQEDYHRNLEHELTDIDKDARLKKK